MAMAVAPRDSVGAKSDRQYQPPRRESYATLDGNEAVARVAYALNEVIAIYPITPASPMGEWADAWAAEARPNVWGTVPTVVELQSEAGMAGTVHGALQTGALTTTFTASQGLLLTIPNLYKIAGELTSAVIHVAARSLACQGLSIFGDHSDVMAARQTGWAMLCSASVQEAHDFALISQLATWRSRLPFMHFFDGFRTSHEVQKIALIDAEAMRSIIPEDAISAHRHRALTPDHPVLRGTAQNPDVYFQGRETVNPFYDACPGIVVEAMNQVAALTGRQYGLFDYVGSPTATRVIVLMGSGCETVEETVKALRSAGEEVGVLKVRLYRPWDAAAFVAQLPESVQAIAVLDRTKEPGSVGEPLYQDVVTALMEAWPGSLPKVVGGRYGLSSKEFTPAMAKAVFDQLTLDRPKNHFTIGINDDVSQTSLAFDPDWSIEPDETVRAIFYGLGSDGTVGANKNSIKIIGEETENFAQGYFVYDSKKSGAITVSHLRFGPEPIHAPYLIDRANFIACHQWTFWEKLDMLAAAVPGATVLLNTSLPREEIWNQLPKVAQAAIVRRGLKVWAIDGYTVARDNGMGGHINTVMQTCFFALSAVLPKETAIAKIKQAIQKSYGKKGQHIVDMNLKAVDNTLANLYEVTIGAQSTTATSGPAIVPGLEKAPDFFRNVEAPMLARQGDDLPVSAIPCDGTFPTGTSRWEKRNIAQFIPTWDENVCIQCGKCIAACPHATIRGKSYDAELLANAPATFKSIETKDKSFGGETFTIQIAPEDCTGCGICVDVCPAKNRAMPSRKALNMEAQAPLREAEAENWDFFLELPDPDRRKLSPDRLRQQQWQRPLFEFSGACAGCGETPYLKMVSQLFGDRMIVANATGCSSIYGGNLPTTPWTTNDEGRGPAWSNSLFEDNAEFGLGFRVSIDKQALYAAEILSRLAALWDDTLAADILGADQTGEAEIWDQRQRVGQLKERLTAWLADPAAAEDDRAIEARRLLDLADYLVKKSVWIVGGDGWAYDIGFGGLDHVLASGRNVNVLVLDTEVYSNTGGQASKSTPRGAVAKFAAGGKPAAKKDLGAIAMTYGTVYVASVALGARDEHTLRVLLEAEAYDGPSLIIAYSHCVAHGIDMTTGMSHQRALVESGRWLLYRYHPDWAAEGKNPLHIDSPPPKHEVKDSMYAEARFKMLTKTRPADAAHLLTAAQADVTARWEFYHYLANRAIGQPEAPDPTT